eukprot:5934226-Pyramimonas_sp.AAC.1
MNTSNQADPAMGAKDKSGGVGPGSAKPVSADAWRNASCESGRCGAAWHWGIGAPNTASASAYASDSQSTCVLIARKHRVIQGFDSRMWR